MTEFCAHTGILPSPAYWQKKRAGKRVNQRRLPKELDPREKVAALSRSLGEVLGARPKPASREHLKTGQS